MISISIYLYIDVHSVLSYSANVSTTTFSDQYVSSIVLSISVTAFTYWMLQQRFSFFIYNVEWIVQFVLDSPTWLPLNSYSLKQAILYNSQCHNQAFLSSVFYCGSQGWQRAMQRPCRNTHALFLCTFS